MLVVGIIGLMATIYSAFVLEESVSALDTLYVHGDEKIRFIEEVETSLEYYRSLSLRHIAKTNDIVQTSADFEKE